MLFRVPFQVLATIGTSNDVCLLFYMVGESDQFYIVRKVCDLDCFMYVLLS